LDWGDQRAGRWTFVGQVTCARSDDWEKKAGEAKRGRWRLILGDDLEPTPFLAVPHHVEDIVMKKLVVDVKSLVLDRLRLAPYLQPIAGPEREVADAILAANVEYL
jgi:hypothetical protein